MGHPLGVKSREGAVEPPESGGGCVEIRQEIGG